MQGIKSDSLCQIPGEAQPIDGLRLPAEIQIVTTVDDSGHQSALEQVHCRIIAQDKYLLQ